MKNEKGDVVINLETLKQNIANNLMMKTGKFG